METLEACVPAVSPAEKDRLAAILKRRDVRRIAYFHCDHFEPWRASPSSPTLERNAEEVVRFAEACASNEYARRLTLFYKANVPYTREVASPGVTLATPGDIFGFLDRTPEQVGIFRTALSALLETVPHEVQVHIHHEHFTSNSGHRDPKLIEAFAKPEIRAMDGARFELALRRSLSAIREETGLPLDRWFFVHGVWALNASDSSVCTITDEIRILMRNGGLGDFTFPAGRPNVDPVHEEPFFVRPLDAVRAYDLAEAEPERAYGNGAAAADKFFIWASPIRHSGSSIDHFSPWLAEKLEAPVPFAEEILEKSVVKDGTLWFKTHAHSMHSRYAEDGPAIFPHEYPPLIRLMGTVFDAADSSGAEVAFVTASEAYDAFVGAPPAGAEPFALSTPYDIRSDCAGDTIMLRGESEINEIAVAVVKEAVEAEGIGPSGAGDYYASRAERGEILMGYEASIARFLLTRKGRVESVYEVGSGLSVLPMLLAANGLKAVGIERDSARAALGRSILERVEAVVPETSARCELWGNPVPGALKDVDGSRAAIVFTNITSSLAPELRDQLIAKAAEFRLAIVDVSRFFVVRDKEQQHALLSELEAAGWGRPEHMFGSYWCFGKSISE